MYFMDKTGIHLVVDDGQNCQAGELFEMVREEMKFPESSREVFSLWLVSDLLGKYCLLRPPQRRPTVIGELKVSFLYSAVFARTSLLQSTGDSLSAFTLSYLAK